MRAVFVERFGGPEVLTPVERPDPVAGPGQVVVRLRAAGVNPVDAICRLGAAPWMTVPFTPGFDGAGVVEAVSEGTALRLGQWVYVAMAGGTYAEAIAVDAAVVHPLPDGVSFAEGAALGIPYATAYGALFFRAGLTAGETLLIRGACGAVGWAALQLAKRIGARVIGTAGSDEGLALLRANGVAAIDHRSADTAAAVRDATKGHGPDVILETQSAKLAEDTELIAPDGRIAVIGDRTPVLIDPYVLTSRRASLIGVNVGGFTAEENQIIHTAIGEGLADGSIRPRIAASFPLNDAARAHEALGRPGLNGKIVLTIPV